MAKKLITVATKVDDDIDDVLLQIKKATGLTKSQIACQIIEFFAHNVMPYWTEDQSLLGLFRSIRVEPA